eukprot:2334598-Rhodomonas_salina.2
MGSAPRIRTPTTAGAGAGSSLGHERWRADLKALSLGSCMMKERLFRTLFRVRHVWNGVDRQHRASVSCACCLPVVVGWASLVDTSSPPPITRKFWMRQKQAQCHASSRQRWLEHAGAVPSWSCIGSSLQRSQQCFIPWWVNGCWLLVQRLT